MACTEARLGLNWSGVGGDIDALDALERYARASDEISDAQDARYSTNLARLGLQIDDSCLTSSGHPDDEAERGTQRREESDVGDGYFHDGSLSARRVGTIGHSYLRQRT